MLILAYLGLIISIVSLIIGVVIYAVTVGGHLVMFGTPPGAIAASLFMLLSAASGLCGVILAVIHARMERFARPALICLCLNGGYVVSVGLLVAAGLLLQMRQRADSSEVLAKYQAQSRDAGVVTAKAEIDNYLITNLKQGVVLMPMQAFKPLTNRVLGNGMKIVGVYLPASGDETRDRERGIITGGMGNAVQTLLGYLVTQGRTHDALILLDAMEQAHVSAHRKDGERYLWTADLRKELASGSFKAADYAGLLDEHKVVAGFLAAQP